MIYATALGATLPPVATGFAGPTVPLAIAAAVPDVPLGGLSLPLYYAGLAPGEVGVNQINALVAGWAPVGMQVPLTINLRVID